VTLRRANDGDDGPRRHLLQTHPELTVGDTVCVNEAEYDAWHAARRESLEQSSPTTGEDEIMGESLIKVETIGDDGQVTLMSLKSVSRLKVVGVWLNRNGDAHSQIKARGASAKMVALHIAPKCRALRLLGAKKEAREVLNTFVLSTFWYGIDGFTLNRQETERVANTVYYVTWRCLGDGDDSTYGQRSELSHKEGLPSPFRTNIAMHMKLWGKLRRDSSAMVAGTCPPLDLRSEGRE
jgi:hypothetical protein